MEKTFNLTKQDMNELFRLVYVAKTNLAANQEDDTKSASNHFLQSVEEQLTQIEKRLVDITNRGI